MKRRRRSKQIDTSFRKTTRGMARQSLNLIGAMVEIVEAASPITGRGVGYQLFARGLIPSMSRSEMQRVYRLLKRAREDYTIDWDDIVDEARELEKVSSWSKPEDFARSATQQYRRDFWDQQPNRCEVWSEKGTIRGVLAPVLDRLGVGFRVHHGFSSATTVHEVADDDDGRELRALYVGDWDPSGMYMSEVDLPERLEGYGGYHVTVKRIALTRDQLTGLLSFPASDKRKDPRYRWFVRKFGARCWEIDALDPNVLRGCVERWIQDCIGDREAWARCERVNQAERESLRNVLSNWAGRRS
jgi:hypothetical protein